MNARVTFDLLCRDAAEPIVSSDAVSNACAQWQASRECLLNNWLLYGSEREDAWRVLSGDVILSALVSELATQPHNTALANLQQAAAAARAMRVKINAMAKPMSETTVTDGIEVPRQSVRHDHG